jgi:hypothetical protein
MSDSRLAACLLVVRVPARGIVEILHRRFRRPVTDLIDRLPFERVNPFVNRL